MGIEYRSSRQETKGSYTLDFPVERDEKIKQGILTSIAILGALYANQLNPGEKLIFTDSKQEGCQVTVTLVGKVTLERIPHDLLVGEYFKTKEEMLVYFNNLYSGQLGRMLEPEDIFSIIKWRKADKETLNFLQKNSLGYLRAVSQVMREADSSSDSHKYPDHWRRQGEIEIKTREIWHKRQQTGMSLGGLSKTSGIPKSSISDLERGKTTYVSDIEVVELARALGFDIKDLIEDSEAIL